jgi:hypothetical protein
MDETHNSEAYWLAGIVLPVDKISGTKSALTTIAEAARDVWDMPAVPELHGHDLFHGKGDFKAVPPRALIGIYEDALEVVAAAEPIIVLRGVGRQHLLHQNPHRLAWRYAIESIDEQGGEGPTLVVADKHAETEEALKGDVQDYLSTGTGGWKPRTLKNVLPELKFLDSHTNTLLQGVDLVAFMHLRRSSIAAESDSRNQTARERLWSHVSPHVAVSRLWTPPPAYHTPP